MGKLAQTMVIADELMERDQETWNTLDVCSAWCSDSSHATITTEYDEYYRITVGILKEYELENLAKPLIDKLQRYLEDDNFHFLNTVIDRYIMEHVINETNKEV